MVTISSFIVSLVFCAVVTANKSLYLSVDGPTSVDSIDNLLVVTTLTNTGDETLVLLKDPRSHLSNLPTHKFIISDINGTSPIFNGHIVNYNHKQAMTLTGENQFTTLVPGQSFEVTHNLGNAYSFAETGPGRYNVHAPAHFQIVDSATDSLISLKADTDRHTFVLTKISEDHTNKFTKRIDAQYPGCTAERIGNIGNIASRAEAYARDTFAFLRNEGADGSQRYRDWFGDYSTARFATVYNNFQKIDAADFRKLTYDCGTCTDPALNSYIDLLEQYVIYLCPLFWKTNLDGTDSQAGKVLSLASQFTDIAGTVDLVSGRDQCLAYALTSATLAVTNADSYEYFAENNPPS